MSKTAVMTLRMPTTLKRDVERLAARFGHKPAQLGVRLIEEATRKRDFPHVDLRETAAGRVAYVAGTRFAVHWVAGIVPGILTVEAFAEEYDVPVERIRTALAYSRAFAEEIALDKAQAEANRKWIEAQDAARSQKGDSGQARAKAGEKATR